MFSVDIYGQIPSDTPIATCPPINTPTVGGCGGYIDTMEDSCSGWTWYADSGALAMCFPGTSMSGWVTSDEEDTNAVAARAYPVIPGNTYTIKASMYASSLGASAYFTTRDWTCDTLTISPYFISIVNTDITGLISTSGFTTVTLATGVTAGESYLIVAFRAHKEDEDSPSVFFDNITFVDEDVPTCTLSPTNTPKNTPTPLQTYPTPGAVYIRVGNPAVTPQACYPYGYNSPSYMSSTGDGRFEISAFCPRASLDCAEYTNITNCYSLFEKTGASWSEVTDVTPYVGFGYSSYWGERTWYMYRPTPGYYEYRVSSGGVYISADGVMANQVATYTPTCTPLETSTPLGCGGFFEGFEGDNWDHSATWSWYKLCDGGGGADPAKASSVKHSGSYSLRMAFLEYGQNPFWVSVNLRTQPGKTYNISFYYYNVDVNAYSDLPDDNCGICPVNCSTSGMDALSTTDSQWILKEYNGVTASSPVICLEWLIYADEDSLGAFFIDDLSMIDSSVPTCTYTPTNTYTQTSTNTPVPTWTAASTPTLACEEGAISIDGTCSEWTMCGGSSCIYGDPPLYQPHTPPSCIFTDVGPNSHVYRLLYIVPGIEYTLSFYVYPLAGGFPGEGLDWGICENDALGFSGYTCAGVKGGCSYSGEIGSDIYGLGPWAQHSITFTNEAGTNWQLIDFWAKGGGTGILIDDITIQANGEICYTPTPSGPTPTYTTTPNSPTPTPIPTPAGGYEIPIICQNYRYEASNAMFSRDTLGLTADEYANTYDSDMSPHYGAYPYNYVYVNCLWDDETKIPPNILIYVSDTNTAYPDASYDLVYHLPYMPQVWPFADNTKFAYWNMYANCPACRTYPIPMLVSLSLGTQYYFAAVGADEHMTPIPGIYSDDSGDNATPRLGGYGWYTATPTLTKTTIPTSTSIPTETSVPTETPVNTPIPTLTKTPIFTWTVAPTYTLVPTHTLVPTYTEIPTWTGTHITPTYTHWPTWTPVSTWTPISTWTRQATLTTIPTETPVNTYTPTHTKTQIGTKSPIPTHTTIPTETPVPTYTFIDPPSPTFGVARGYNLLVLDSNKYGKKLHTEARSSDVLMPMPLSVVFGEEFATVGYVFGGWILPVNFRKSGKYSGYYDVIIGDATTYSGIPQSLMWAGQWLQGSTQCINIEFPLGDKVEPYNYIVRGCSESPLYDWIRVEYDPNRYMLVLESTPGPRYTATPAP